jgi:hypothetical protein
MEHHHVLKRHITWELTESAEYPYQAVIDGVRYVVRINDFPEEMLYTLIVDSHEYIDFNSWPACWVRPPQTQSGLDRTGPTT